MFVHNKDLQFEVRVDRPDPRFASLLMDQFGGANGELTAALQYSTQAFVLRQKNPKMYDLVMDIATEELSHLERVGSMITMLLDGLNDNLKIANEKCDWMPAVAANGGGRDSLIHSVAVNPLFLVLSGGGPDVKDSGGNNWTGAYIDANGDPTVDLRNNVAAESRAKIVYEYLKQFTDDPGVQDTLTFLMTREVAHYQQFTAALNELPVNFRRDSCRAIRASRTRRSTCPTAVASPFAVRGTRGRVPGPRARNGSTSKSQKNSGWAAPLARTPAPRRTRRVRRRSTPRSRSPTNSTFPPDNWTSGRAGRRICSAPGPSHVLSASAGPADCPRRGR